MKELQVSDFDLSSVAPEIPSHQIVGYPVAPLGEEVARLVGMGTAAVPAVAERGQLSRLALVGDGPWKATPLDASMGKRGLTMGDQIELTTAVGQDVDRERFLQQQGGEVGETHISLEILGPTVLVAAGGVYLLRRLREYMRTGGKGGKSGKAAEAQVPPATATSAIDRAAAVKRGRPMSRRDMLRLLGGLTLVGALAGCTPESTVVAQQKQEGVATASPPGGAGFGTEATPSPTVSPTKAPPPPPSPTATATEAEPTLTPTAKTEAPEPTAAATGVKEAELVPLSDFWHTGVPQGESFPVEHQELSTFLADEQKRGALGIAEGYQTYSFQQPDGSYLLFVKTGQGETSQYWSWDGSQLVPVTSTQGKDLALYARSDGGQDLALIYPDGSYTYHYAREMGFNALQPTSQAGGEKPTAVPPASAENLGSTNVAAVTGWLPDWGGRHQEGLIWGGSVRSPWEIGKTVGNIIMVDGVVRDVQVNGDDVFVTVTIGGSDKVKVEGGGNSVKLRLKNGSTWFSFQDCYEGMDCNAVPLVGPDGKTITRVDDPRSAFKADRVIGFRVDRNPNPASGTALPPEFLTDWVVLFGATTFGFK